MHPAFSVLIFTVTSGFGYGLMIMLILAQLHHGEPMFSDVQYFAALGLALALISIGLLSSTFHLANKKNAWRAFSQFKTSWLSREGVLAIAFYPLVLTYIALLWQQHFESTVASTVFGVLCIALSFVLTHCTAMIYASLKTIPQWHSSRVPAAFQLFCVYSGVLLYIAVLAVYGKPVPGALTAFAGLLAVAGLVMKLEYFTFVGRPETTTINTATTFTEARVRLFDTGHSAENFLQREFVYDVGPKTKMLARRLMLATVFLVPVCMLILQHLQFVEAVWSRVLLVVFCYLGLLLERWLFFVEAKHVVRRFYGSH